MSESTTTEVHQPLHPSIIARLDPQYIEFHNKNVVALTPVERLKWHPSMRDGPAIPGSSPPLPVGDIKDFDLSKTQVRTYIPKGQKPANGWPVLIYFHGGGWTYGNMNSEASLITNVCVRANAAVVSVHYRLAPENPYPAAVEDAVESLDWVLTKGKDLLSLDTSKIAFGGSSSGGNLATILALKNAERGPGASVPIKLQLLIVPATDHLAESKGLWAANIHAPWLTPDRMRWFAHGYLPHAADRTKWDASPFYAPDALLQTLPKALFLMTELDILLEEGQAYAAKLRALGVDVEEVVYKGAPHPIMAMDGALEVGARLVTDAVNAVADAFRE